MTEPILQQDRIQSLDLLRGFAVLGILIMNVQSFSMPEAAYLNPMAYGDLTGLNKWIWIISHILADNKFMSIFSMLFGAGIVLMSSRIEKKGRRSAAFHYRRILWLLLFGLVHAYLFWYGDILVAYAVCGILVYLFRKLKPGWLLTIGVAVMSVGSLLYLFFGLTLEFWPPEQIEMGKQFWLPPAEELQSEIEAYRGSWTDVFNQRYPMALAMQTFVFFINYGWHTGGLMLIGMALYKWGLFSGERTKKFYLSTFLICALIGYSLVLMGLKLNIENQFSFEYSMYLGSQFNYWGSLFVAIAYSSLIMLVFQSGWFKWCVKSLRLVGRAALSNYLFDTLICTTIFYGYGFGLFARLDRIFHVLIVLVIWITQILITRWWMGKFRFGPAEWLWRSLTYWKRQEMRIIQD